jgi:hypothetical protein
VGRLNAIQRFGPGTRILFRAGDTFVGGLDIQVVGTPTSPVTIGTYGSGKATLTDFAPYTDSIVQLTNSEYVTVQDLRFVGTLGRDYGTTNFAPLNTSYGLYVVSYRSTGHKLQSVHVTRAEFGGTQFGAFFDASTTPDIDGFNDLSFTDSIVDGVYQAGVYVIGYGSNAGGPVDQSSNVSIGDNQFRNILGYPGYPSEAQPLFVGGTVGIKIESNLFANNCGLGGISAGAPLGGSTAFSVANCRDFQVRYNEVYGTKSHTPWDGSAIDIDQDAQNGEIAYNLTYNNDGPAIQLGSYGGKVTTDLAIHDNMSYNDVRGNTSRSVQGAIRCWGNTKNVQLFNNTIYIAARGSIGTPSAISFEVGRNYNFKSYNNILKTTAGVPMVRPNGTAPGDYNATHIDSSNRFVANLYDSSGASLLISTDNTKGSYVDITSLSAWHAAGQEQVGSTNYGVDAGAGFASQKPPSGYLPNLPVSDYTGLDIGARSAARDAAADPWPVITVRPPTTVGRADFHGHVGPIRDIGADTYQPRAPGPGLAVESQQTGA